MELQAIRHAESTAQTGEGDWLDPDLTAFGERQARDAADYFSDKEFDLALVSPLRRARRTFELASPRADHARFDSRLVECTLDRGPGYDYREILPYPTPGSADADTADMWTAPAGERIASLLQELRGLPLERVLLVAHNGILNVLRSHITGSPILGEPGFDDLVGAYQTKNTGIHGFYVGAGFADDRLLFWNRPASPLA
jgi:broad specificity phosphatase PhoE